MSDAKLPYVTDKYGFPMEPCTRCDGAGRLEMYSHVMGGICAKCNGRKYSYPRGKAGDVAREFYADLRRRQSCIAGNIMVGDVVKPHCGEGWKTVAAVLPTLHWIGSSERGVVGTPSYSRQDFYAELIRFTDGTEAEATRVVWRRKSGVSVEEARSVAAYAQGLYEGTLRRRKAKAASKVTVKPWVTAHLSE